MIGIIEKILFTNEDSGYCIADLELSEFDKNEVPDNFNDSHITIKGYFPCREDMKLEIKGKLSMYKGKPQIEVENFSEVLPATKEGIISYLSSGLIKGIGKITAKRIVDTFGTNTFEVFENTPELLVTVQGVSRNKLDNILKSYQETFDMRKIIQMLMPYGVSANKCFKIQKAFKDKALDIVKNNTYRLVKINGFGFKTVDEIALKLGYTPFDSNRVRFGIQYVLEEAQCEGHLYLPQKELLQKVHDILNENFSQEVVSNSLVVKTICDLANEGILKGNNGCAYLKKNFEREVFVANEIARRITNSKTQKLSDEKINACIEKLEKDNGITFADKQREAISKSVNNSFLLVTGGAGTGKTTVLKYILKACKELTDSKSVCLLAPTGRAASRMSEAVGIQATTIHSKLQIRESDESNDVVIDDDICVVDETSMCDMFIFSQLIGSVSQNTKLILLGDSEQLPSVGAGNVLFELLHSPIARVELNQIQRQKGDDNPIITNSLAVRECKTNLDYSKDTFKLYHTDSQEEAQKRIVSLFLNKLNTYGIENIEIIAPMKKGAAGTNELNKALQNAYNPYRKGIKVIRKGKTEFRVGDKIMQIKNDYSIIWESVKGNEKGMGLFNGEIGYVTDIKDDILIADFDGRIVSIESLENIVLAYAITIHKSQGSEFDCVLMPLLTSQYIMLAKNLLYTGITRAKKEISIIGQKKALTIAIKNNSVAKRNTMLAQRIINELDK